MSEVELAYSTGIFDGEGCINITIHRKVSKRKLASGSERAYVSFRGIVQLAIVNTNRKIIDRVKKVLDFSYLYFTRKPLLELREVNPEKALKIIRLMKPYSITKDMLELSEKACTFILSRKYPRGGWDYEDLDFFERNFIEPFKKLRGARPRGGRPKKYNWRDHIEINGDRILQETSSTMSPWEAHPQDPK